LQAFSAFARIKWDFERIKATKNGKKILKNKKCKFFL